MPNDAARRPYDAPTLIVYGDLISVTLLNTTQTNMNDPGNSSSSKT